MYLKRNVILAGLCVVAGLALTACAQTTLPDRFGVTMVEETTCNGLGGRISMGPDGAFCAGVP